MPTPINERCNTKTTMTSRTKKAKRALRLNHHRSQINNRRVPPPTTAIVPIRAIFCEKYSNSRRPRPCRPPTLKCVRITTEGRNGGRAASSVPTQVMMTKQQNPPPSKRRGTLRLPQLEPSSSERMVVDPEVPRSLLLMSHRSATFTPTHITLKQRGWSLDSPTRWRARQHRLFV